MTVASKDRVCPLETAATFALPVEAVRELAYKQSFFSLADFSAARSRSIPPLLASMPACQSTTRAKPAATRNSATFPAGCMTNENGNDLAIR